MSSNGSNQESAKLEGQPNSETTETAFQYETQHVHEVYDQIAEHFSQTRYKPWPIVSSFLKALPPGSVGLDIGCGNGKYLRENGNVFIVGSDMSEPLLRLAQDASAGSGDAQYINSFVTASTLSLPHPLGRYDFAISIAVIHHLSTRERRIEAVKEILSCLKLNGPASKSNSSSGGRALLYVWALEQKNSRRGWDSGDDQDVMVPWVLKKGPSKQTASNTTNGDQSTPSTKGESESKVYQRYYHLYRKGELEEDVVSAGGRVIDGGYEKDNWWVIASRAE